MKHLIYFYPKEKWDHFNFDTGKIDVEYDNPCVQNKQDWWDKDSAKLEKLKETMIQNETKLKERGNQLSTGNKKPHSIWDFLFTSKGTITGLMPGCPDIKNEKKKGAVKGGQKSKISDKTRISSTKPDATQPICSLTENSSKIDDDSETNLTNAVKKCNTKKSIPVENGKSGVQQNVKLDLQPQAKSAVERKHFWNLQPPEITMELVCGEEIINDKLNEETWKNPKPYLYGNSEMVYIYGGSLFEIMKKSIDIDIADQCFIDNRNLLQQYSLKCDPIKDPRWRFLWLKDHLVTEEVKVLRKSFFEKFIECERFKIDRK